MTDIEFKVGDVVIALNNMGEAACGEHPYLQYCKAGDELVIRRLGNNTWDFYVSHYDVLDKDFGVLKHEVQLKGQ